ncbi:hypothetical protein FZEAL_3241 [Fusarium zealandicum]|uniref:Uncharacterized protein n=1 Tax=Fusarium zealandicum TaxID=1053134 RepID=A0A8H4UPQ1_9HYPO|nr:hypothetical protein FZEAL_3241 [Fusarium zealandicum]
MVNCALILRMSYEIICISASTFFGMSETVYDAHTARFVSIIELGEKLLNEEDAGINAVLKSASDPEFDVAVVQPLFFVVCKCRDWGLRTRAIEGLTRTRTGGFYDSKLQVDAARWIIDREHTDPTKNEPMKFSEVQGFRL